MFDQIYYCVKLHNAACSNACRPVVIHAVIISIIFEHIEVNHDKYKLVLSDVSQFLSGNWQQTVASKVNGHAS